MTSENTRSIARSKREQATARRSVSAGKCRCGQDLDVCSRDHCPRCGSTLRDN